MVEAKNNDGNTPLHYFSLTWSSPNVMEIGELLIKKHKERGTNYKIFSLISKGSTVNVFNNLGETPLHRAIVNPAVRLMIVQLLISHGADVNIPSNSGDSGT